MNFREELVDYSRKDNLRMFWRLFRWRDRTKGRLGRSILTFVCSRVAAGHGGYVGYGARIDEIPSMPHGLHGVYISRYAHIGSGCRIYQNVTIGEIEHKAPSIGSHCLIGAGAVIIGGITIGDYVKIGAGAVVSCDVPSCCTVVSQPPRILPGVREEDLAAVKDGVLAASEEEAENENLSDGAGLD